MINRKLLLSLVLLAFLTTNSLTYVMASPGTPESMQFGFGGWLDLDGRHINASVNAAAGMGMDWIAVDLDWGRTWNDPAVAPDLTILNQVMAQAKKANLNVMLSITNPPAWVMTPTGPDQNLTSSLAFGLKQMYPDSLTAVELFPEANTAAGWGGKPDPAAYGSLLNTTCQLLQKNNIELTLVAGGLKPLSNGAAPEDMDDLVFLENLYKSSTSPCLSVISIRLPEITGNPMSQTSAAENRHLRHYEDVRQVMLKNNQAKNVIWITRFSWPSPNISGYDAIYMRAEEQAAWLNQSYRLLRAQLYIGTAFFSRINAPAQLQGSTPVSLILPDGSMHFAAQQMTNLVSMSGSIKSVIFEGNISKKTIEKLDLKPASP
jgi:hypothetical protein